jgi:hypothetical protein
MVEQRLAELNLESIFPSGGYFPSPLAWEDWAFYFLLLDASILITVPAASFVIFE